MWKKNNVNATAIVLKVIYDDADAKHKGQAVNSVANNKLLCVYVGDDCYKEMKEHAGHIPDLLEDLHDNGVEVVGLHIPIQFVAGGDFKLLCSWLGLAGGNSKHGCACCETPQDVWHLSMENLLQHFQQRGQQGIPSRNTGRQYKLSHHPLDDPYNCPACGEQVTPDTQPKVFPSESARLKWQQLHFGTCNFCIPYLTWLPAENFIFDILHAVLRIVPVLWRHTVSKHLTEEQLRSVCQFFFDATGVQLNSKSAGQSASGKDNGSGGRDCWPGEVCYAVMDNYEAVLNETYTEDQSEERLRDAEAVWQAFIKLAAELHAGCDENSPDAIEEHAVEVETLAEDVRTAFLKVASLREVTVYMHVLVHHASTTIRRWGSLSKFSSQGVEATHQVTKFVARYRAQRKARSVHKTVVIRTTLRQKAEEVPVINHRSSLVRMCGGRSQKQFQQHQQGKRRVGAKCTKPEIKARRLSM